MLKTPRAPRPVAPSADRRADATLREGAVPGIVRYQRREPIGLASSYSAFGTRVAFSFAAARAQPGPVSDGSPRSRSPARGRCSDSSARRADRAPLDLEG